MKKHISLHSVDKHKAAIALPSAITHLKKRSVLQDTIKQVYPGLYTTKITGQLHNKTYFTAHLGFEDLNCTTQSSWETFLLLEKNYINAVFNNDFSFILKLLYLKSLTEEEKTNLTTRYGDNPDDWIPRALLQPGSQDDIEHIASFIKEEKERLHLRHHDIIKTKTIKGELLHSIENEPSSQTPYVIYASQNPISNFFKLDSPKSILGKFTLSNPMRVIECINRIRDNLTGKRAHLLIVMGSFNSSQRLQELSYDHMHKSLPNHLFQQNTCFENRYIARTIHSFIRGSIPLSLTLHAFSAIIHQKLDPEKKWLMIAPLPTMQAIIFKNDTLKHHDDIIVPALDSLDEEGKKAQYHVTGETPVFLKISALIRLLHDS